jgi:1-acyl-sn-glycerol-3-phosphate acyltransferase
VYYLKIALIQLWFVFACGLGVLFSLFRWGDLNLNHDFTKVMAWGMLRIARWKVDVEGGEFLESSQPCVYLANHQGTMDMATFGSIYPHRTLVIAKTELKWVPCVGLFLYAAGNIMIHRQSRSRAIAGLSEAVEQIRRKNASVWVFPEGTRNRTRENMLPFKKGAFYMAVEAGIPLVPVIAQRLTPLLDQERRILVPGRVRVRVLPPIPTAGIKQDEVEGLIQKTWELMNEAVRGLST